MLPDAALDLNSIVDISWISLDLSAGYKAVPGTDIRDIRDSRMDEIENMALELSARLTLPKAAHLVSTALI